MNPYIQNLNRIEFLVTLACTGRCKHCSEGEHALDGEHINGDLAIQAVYELCKEFRIDSLMTFGGEPLLYFDEVSVHMMKILQMCAPFVYRQTEMFSVVIVNFFNQQFNNDSIVP